MNPRGCLLCTFIILLISIALPVSAQLPSPSILINPVSGPVGTSISVKGTNFLLNSEVRVFWENTLAGSGKTDSKGSFSVSIKVPEVPCGYYKITAVDEVKNNAYTTFRVTPKITKISSSQGAPGSFVNITGNGFSANSQVEVRFVDLFNETQNLAVKKVEADEKGLIQVELQIPNVSPGEYKIYALDAKTGLKTDYSKFTVVLPKTTPTPTTTPTVDKNQTNQTSTTPPTTPKKTPTAYTPRATPGFEALIAIGGVATALLILRSKR